jgi:gliding motility-associated-like protein
MVDLKFQLGENFTANVIDLADLEYRILAGTCGAMTPIACSAGNINLTLNCLGPGDYYVQVSLPEKGGPNSLDVEGTLSLTVTATPSNPVLCSDPLDPNEVNANFIYTSDCQTLTFLNLSTAGFDIVYLWEFPDSTTTEANPTWTPPPGITDFPVTLTVTNIALGLTTSTTLQVSVNAPFASYSPMSDTVICNNTGTVILDATLTGATYKWDDNSTNPTRTISTAGMYWVIINAGGCEKRDTAIINSIDARRTISPTLCPGESIIVNNEVFDNTNPSGTVTIPNAHVSGCDSILMVNLSFYSAATSQFSETICVGEVYSFGNQNLTQSGSYTDTLSSARGCDSIVTLALTVTPRQTLSHDVSGCIGASLPITPSISGNTYAWSNGSNSDTLNVSAPGTFSVSVSDNNGCIISEETFSVSFGILSSPGVTAPDPVCNGEDVLLTATGSSGIYQWFDAAVGGTLLGTGATLLITNVQNNTIIYVEAMQVGNDTCLSLREPVPVQLSVEPIQNIADDTVICAGNSVVLPWGEIVMPEIDASFTHSWQYTISGCDSLIFTVDVDIVEVTPLSLPSELELQFGDSVLLVPQIDFTPDSIAWAPANGLSCTDCLQPWAKPSESTDYVLTIWSPEGCIVTAMIHIEINRDIKFYVPNVFTPDDNGVNDKFTVFGNREVRLVRSLFIYDRWGNGVWQDFDFVPGGSSGWDGFCRGKPMGSGVYVWVAELEFFDGSKEVVSGHVTLVR